MCDSEDEMDTQGVVIEKLPTVGSAYSLKTIKQGRRVSIKETVNFQGDIATVKETGSHRNVGRRNLRKDNLSVLLYNAKRIVNFKHSTEKQKAAAQYMLEQHEKGIIHFGTINTVKGIIRTLSKQYREF
jgi:hypothetical protein